MTKVSLQDMFPNILDGEDDVEPPIHLILHPDDIDTILFSLCNGSHQLREMVGSRQATACAAEMDKLYANICQQVGREELP